MNNFRIISIILSLCTLCLAQNLDYFGTPYYLWISTYTPGSAGYQNGWLPGGTGYYHQEGADNIKDALSTALAAKYPSIRFGWSDNNQSNFTLSSFNSTAASYEINYVHTHGNDDLITFWPQNELGYIRSGYGPTLVLSGYCKHLLLYSCLTMYDINDISTIFKGGHSISGSACQTYNFDKKYCHKHWLLGKWHCHDEDHQSYRLGSWFAEYFINQGLSIAQSWKQALCKTQYEFAGHGVHAKTYGLWGNVSNYGTYTGPLETITNFYNGALWLNQQDMNDYPHVAGRIIDHSGSNGIIGYISATGTPNYDYLNVLP